MTLAVPTKAFLQLSSLHSLGALITFPCPNLSIHGELAGSDIMKLKVHREK